MHVFPNSVRYAVLGHAQRRPATGEASETAALMTLDDWLTSTGHWEHCTCTRLPRSTAIEGAQRGAAARWALMRFVAHCAGSRSSMAP